MRVLLTLCAFLIPIACASAQEAPALATGTRLRVTLASPDRDVRIGAFRSFTDTTLLLAVESMPVSIPIAAIDRLERSRGRKPNVLAGVLGFVVGAALGGTVGCLANADSYGVFCAGQDDTKVIAGMALGGAAGAYLGAVLFRKERWSPVEPMPGAKRWE